MNKTCEKILKHIEKAKDNVLRQFSDLLAEQEHALRLALNEAEALAWQTPYPQLVFQDLAEEKAQGVLNWVARQRAVRRGAIL